MKVRWGCNASQRVPQFASREPNLQKSQMRPTGCNWTSHSCSMIKCLRFLNTSRNNLGTPLLVSTVKIVRPEAHHAFCWLLVSHAEKCSYSGKKTNNA